MVSGRFDDLFTLEDGQLPMMRLLGTVPVDKRHVPVNVGHGNLTREVPFRETTSWLDRYLGEVRR